MHKLRLPIANPCHENWDAMHAEGGGARFCDQCSKSVHNLSDMTESDARELLAAPRGKDGLCIRYTAEASGKVRFRTPSTQAPSPTAFLGWRNAAAAGIAAMALSGCADKDRQPTSVEETHCNYEVGPFGYSLARGEGNCPPVETIHDPGVPMMGAAVPEPPPEPEMGEMVEPEPELMGKVAAPDPVEVMGEAPAQPDVPCESEKTPESPEVKGQAPAETPKPIKKMGKIKKPVEDKVLMGDVAAPEDL